MSRSSQTRVMKINEYMTEENRLDFEKVLMLPDPGVAMHDALEELKKCYEELDEAEEKIKKILKVIA